MLVKSGMLNGENLLLSILNHSRNASSAYLSLLKFLFFNPFYVSTITDLEDIFIGHIHAMDTLARGLLIANDILQNSDYTNLKIQRYKSFNHSKGLLFSEKKLSLKELASLASNKKDPNTTSGKQELFESIINKYIK